MIVPQQYMGQRRSSIDFTGMNSSANGYSHSNGTTINANQLNGYPAVNHDGMNGFLDPMSFGNMTQDGINELARHIMQTEAIGSFGLAQQVFRPCLNNNGVEPDTVLT